MVLGMAFEGAVQSDIPLTHATHVSFDNIDLLSSSAQTHDFQDSESAGIASDIHTLTEAFQQHWRQVYAEMGKPFSDYKLAYIFGFSLANDDYDDPQPWKDLEVSVRNHWECYQPGTWDEFKASIQFGREMAFQLK